ncbi:nucleotidyltransferase domain-containing protein [bacterium]|nr:nucleotidyltransferase domain-containing protein [bacterium]
MDTSPRIPIDQEKIKAFCEKWKITEFSLFGSVLSDDFRPDSDVDVLVTFEKNAPWSLFDIVDMEAELGGILGRKIDLSERSAVESSRNRYRRSSILATARRVYGS